MEVTQTRSKPGTTTGACRGWGTGCTSREARGTAGSVRRPTDCCHGDFMESDGRGIVPGRGNRDTGGWIVEKMESRGRKVWLMGWLEGWLIIYYLYRTVVVIRHIALAPGARVVGFMR